MEPPWLALRGVALEAERLSASVLWREEFTLLLLPSALAVATPLLLFRRGLEVGGAEDPTSEGMEGGADGRLIDLLSLHKEIILIH